MILTCHSVRFLVVEAEIPISYLIRWEFEFEPCDTIHPSWEAALSDIFILGKGWSSSVFIWSLSTSQQQFPCYVPSSETPNPSCENLSEDLLSSIS